MLEEAQQLAVEKYNVKDKSNLWVGEYFEDLIAALWFLLKYIIS